MRPLLFWVLPVLLASCAAPPVSKNEAARRRLAEAWADYVDRAGGPALDLDCRVLNGVSEYGMCVFRADGDVVRIMVNGLNITRQNDAGQGSRDFPYRCRTDPRFGTRTTDGDDGPPFAFRPDVDVYGENLPIAPPEDASWPRFERLMISPKEGWGCVELKFPTVGGVDVSQ